MNIFERFRIARENYQEGYRASREMGRLERAKAGKEVKSKKTVKKTKVVYINNKLVKIKGDKKSGNTK